MLLTTTSLSLKATESLPSNSSYADALKLDSNSADPTTSNLQGQTASKNGSRAKDKCNHTFSKKFNTVIFGLSECPKGSPKYERITHDTNLVCKTVQSVYPNLSDYAICDCSRIGKYSEDRTRPLIVKFARSCDVTAILSNRHKLSKTEFPKVSIKPFMSTAERKTESTLLKERRALIDNGVERRHIRIRGNSIYANGIKVGSANEDVFIRHQQSEDKPPISTHSTDSSTNNVERTNSTSNGSISANNIISPNQQSQDLHMGMQSSTSQLANSE